MYLPNHGLPHKTSGKNRQPDGGASWVASLNVMVFADVAVERADDALCVCKVGSME